LKLRVTFYNISYGKCFDYVNWIPVCQLTVGLLVGSLQRKEQDNFLTRSVIIMYVLRLCESRQNPNLTDDSATRCRYISIYQAIIATVPSSFYL